MPYINREQQRKIINNSRQAKKERRVTEAKILLGNRCVICHTQDNLQFDHIDPKTKLFSISWAAFQVSEERFWLEVSKCQLLCALHHIEKSTKDGSVLRGEAHGVSRLRDLDIKYIFGLAHLGHSQSAISREFGISQPHTSRILLRQSWKHLTP